MASEGFFWPFEWEIVQVVPTQLHTSTGRIPLQHKKGSNIKLLVGRCKSKYSFLRILKGLYVIRTAGESVTIEV